MKFTARSSFIWAAILLVVSLLLTRYRAEITGIYVPTADVELYKWWAAIVSALGLFTLMTSAALIGASAIIKALAPQKPHQVSPADTSSDTAT